MADRPRDTDLTLPSQPRDEGAEHTLSSSGTDPAPAPAGQGDLPEQIGGYRIFGRLGEGGMGVVFEAEQPSPRRRVALKVVRGTEHFDELRFRMFEREASTLARLHHPGIGAIYASGRTRQGRQFFAMELVRGPTLDRWLADRPGRPDKGEIALRLRMFRQVCDAVHYAHQRGVIHRDLKPSNLIVTQPAQNDEMSTASTDPVVKILDFGLARVTESDPDRAELTAEGTVKGTLPYMAPEQARGDTAAVDVRTDVYALGVILYELLTGRRPYAVDATSLMASVRVICEQAPGPLAAAWTATSRLDPDLATVVNTALDKEPDHRYASAAAFGEDVGRLLASQPILARPPSTMYQLRKLVARRKPVFATAGVALALLVVAAVGISVLYVRSERNLSRAVVAEQTARREAETAQRTADFLVEIFDQADPVRSAGRDVSAREVVDEGARRLERGLADEPLLKARLLGVIAKVYKSLGQFEPALQLARQSRQLRLQFLPDGDVAIADADFLLASILEATGDRDGAQVAYDRALAAYNRLGKAGQRGVIDTQGGLAWMLGTMGQFARADTAITQALALARSQSPRDEGRLMRLQSNRATLLMNQGVTDSALAVLNQALESARRVGDDEMAATLLTNIGVAHAMAEQPALSTEPYREALRLYRRIYGENHPMVARALGNVGINLAQQGQVAEAMPFMRESLAAQIAVYGKDSPIVGQAHMNLGLAQMQTGDVAAAEKSLTRAVELNERAAADGKSISLSMSLYHLAGAKSALGRLDQARALLERVVAMDTEIFGPESDDVLGDLEDLAILERTAGNEARARELERRVQEIRADRSGP